jgi:hypothetical protein
VVAEGVSEERRSSTPYTLTLSIGQRIGRREGEREGGEKRKRKEGREREDVSEGALESELVRRDPMTWQPWGQGQGRGRQARQQNYMHALSHNPPCTQSRIPPFLDTNMYHSEPVPII